MYKIPEDFNLNALIGTNVQQICFTINGVCLFFEGVGFVQIEHSFQITCKNIVLNEMVSPVTKDNGLLVLLEKKVINIEVENNRTKLIILFEENISLELDSNASYESFSINIAGNEIIV